MSRCARGNSLKAGCLLSSDSAWLKACSEPGMSRCHRLGRSFALPSYFHTVVTMRKMQRLQRKMNASIRVSFANLSGSSG
jgi:hypothetical protein